MKLLSVIKWIVWSRKNTSYINSTKKINYKYIKFENNDFYYFY